MTHKKGYHVWLYGMRYWHRTLAGAGKRLQKNSHWCSGADAQCIEIPTGANKTGEAWDEILGLHYLTLNNQND